MEPFRFYKASMILPEGEWSRWFEERTGVLTPVAEQNLENPIAAWKFAIDTVDMQVRLEIFGDPNTKRMMPAYNDPAYRLLRLYKALAHFKSGAILHGLHLIRFFKHAEELEIAVATEALSYNERMNLLAEALLGSWEPMEASKRLPLLALAKIDPQITEEEFNKQISQWYAQSREWSSRVVGFEHQSHFFLRMENGVERSKIAKGQTCCLVREHYNPADPNAVMVLHENSLKLGYLRRTIAEFLAPLMDQGCIFTGDVCAFLPPEYPADERIYLAIRRAA